MIVNCSYGNYWISESEYKFMTDHLTSVNGSTPFVSGGLEKYITRVVRERLIPKCNTSKKPITLNPEFEEYLKTLEPVKEPFEKVNEVVQNQPSNNTFNVKQGSPNELSIFKRHRTDFLKSVSDYKIARSQYIAYKKTFESNPIIAEIKLCNNKIAQYTKEVEQDFPEKLELFSKADFLRYTYSVNAKHMIKVFQVKLALLEITKENNPDLTNQERVKEALKTERNRKAADMKNKRRFFSQYTILSGSKKTLTAGIRVNDSFCFCNLGIRVSET